MLAEATAIGLGTILTIGLVVNIIWTLANAIAHHSNKKAHRGLVEYATDTTLRMAVATQKEEQLIAEQREFLRLRSLTTPTTRINLPAPPQAGLFDAGGNRITNGQQRNDTHGTTPE